MRAISVGFVAVALTVGCARAKPPLPLAPVSCFPAVRDTMTVRRRVVADTAALGAMRGQLTDWVTGAPLRNAIVYVTGPNRYLQTVHTDSTGRFSFQPSAVGRHEWRMQSEDFNYVARDTATLVPRQLTEVRYRLVGRLPDLGMPQCVATPVRPGRPD